MVLLGNASRLDAVRKAILCWDAWNQKAKSSNLHALQEIHDERVHFQGKQVGTREIDFDWAWIEGMLSAEAVRQVHAAIRRADSDRQKSMCLLEIPPDELNSAMSHLGILTDGIQSLPLNEQRYLAFQAATISSSVDLAKLIDEAVIDPLRALESQIEAECIAAVQEPTGARDCVETRQHDTKDDKPQKKRKKRMMTVGPTDCARIYRERRRLDDTTKMAQVIEDYIEENGTANGTFDTIMRTLNDNPDHWKNAV